MLWPAYKVLSKPARLRRLWNFPVVMHESGIRGLMCCLVQKDHLKEELLGAKHCLFCLYGGIHSDEMGQFWSFDPYLHNTWGVRVVYSHIQMCGRIVGCCIRDCDPTWSQETKKVTKNSGWLRLAQLWIWLNFFLYLCTFEHNETVLIVKCKQDVDCFATIGFHGNQTTHT